MTSTPKSIILVHGAWHGSWCWQRVIPLLQQRGFEVGAVDLPSTGIDPPPQSDLSADAAAVRKVIDVMPGDVLRSAGCAVSARRRLPSRSRTPHGCVPRQPTSFARRTA